MAVLKPSGGPGGRGGPFKLTWRGASVLQEINSAVERGMDAEASEILSDLTLSIHRQSGFMAEHAFAKVEIRGGKRTLVAGSTADYAFFEERRHPQIRKVMDRHIPHIGLAIREALGSRR